MRELTEMELCAAEDICLQRQELGGHTFVSDACPTCRADIVRLVDGPEAGTKSDALLSEALADIRSLNTPLPTYAELMAERNGPAVVSEGRLCHMGRNDGGRYCVECCEPWPCDKVQESYRASPPLHPASVPPSDFLKAMKWLDNECEGMGQPASPDGPLYDAPRCAKIIASYLTALPRTVPPSEGGIDDCMQTVDMLSAILRQIAVAVKGPEGEREMHSWADLPDLVRRLVAAPRTAEAFACDTEVRGGAVCERWCGSDRCMAVFRAALPPIEAVDVLTLLAEEMSRLSWGPYDAVGFVLRYRDAIITGEGK